MRLSRSSPCYHSRKRPALDTTTFVKSRLNCNQYFVIIVKSSRKRPRRLFWITQLDFSFVFKLSPLSDHSESSHTLEPPVSDLPKCQPRTQASSRYPSYQLNYSLTGDFTSKIAEDDWERGCGNESQPGLQLVENLATPLIGSSYKW